MVLFVKGTGAPSLGRIGAFLDKQPLGCES